MVLKDSKSCSTLSLRAVSTFWILVTLIASSSGFPQGNTSNSTTVDPNSNSSSTTITDEVSNSTIATTISPTNEATNTEPASEETTSSPINNDSTIAYLFNTEGSNETEASSTLSPENNSSHNTTLQEQSNQNEGSNPTTTATTTTSPPVTETVTSHPSNDTPIATTINVLSTRVGETTVFEEGHTNQSKEVGTESTANSSSRSTPHTTEEVTTLSSTETNPPTTITSSSATTSVTTISSSSVPVPTTTTQELANSTEATPLATTLKSSSPSTTTQTHEVNKTVPPTMVVSHPVTPTMEEEQIITTEKATDLNNPVVGDGGKVSHSVKLDERIGDLQYQVYAIFASFGIISLIIILLIIALAMSISKLKEQVSSTRHVPYIPDNRTGDQIHAYDNSAFSSGHEMQERRRPHMDKEPSKQGYGVQNGNNTYERPETKSKNSRSKMENIPLESIRQKEAESSQKSKDVGGVDRDSKSTLMRYEDGVIPFQHEGEEPSPNGSMRRKPSS
eukprot:TRINITY_DN2250_c1_g1_i1.p1 TRINITY_DN2250_c1_g1~~TRINITY_DN2250_c1_g1_i1.p1  ORF type:complete len:506 (+),score=84.83 TRINITY_DN2250_c1_g1_i1:167-1684(+)